MDNIKRRFVLLSMNKYPGVSSEDIHEHLHTLYRYTIECDSVFETGVRGVISSWAFLYGLLDGNKSGNKKRFFMNDLDECNIEEILTASNNFDIDVKYEWKNNLELEFDSNYDITFIDTWHVYGQLKRELEKFSKITNKYIIMHDTTIDELYGETIRVGLNANKQSEETGIPIDEINKGLWPAITEFVDTNKEWYIKERFTNNNGLTILARIHEV